MSSKKNAREKKLARQEAARKASRKKFLTNGIALGMLFIGLAVGLTLRTAFGPQTCGNTDSDLELYLESALPGDVTVWKTAQEGRVKAVLYHQQDLGECVALFQSQLFGMRWKYDGMDSVKEDGLQVVGSCLEGGFLRRSRCEVVVCGDNRSGAVASYAMADAQEVARGDLEADRILDIYILDGAGHLPKQLLQYGPDGTELPA